jgi:hypothetical protein
MCFIRMLRMVAVVFKCVSGVFFQVFQKHISTVLTAFKRMLQPLFLDVSKVDRVLHLSSSHLLLHLAVGSKGAGAW